MTEWSAWSSVFLTLAQSENIPHLQRGHGMGPLRLCPRHLVRHSDSLRLLIFTVVVAIYLGLRMLTVKY